MIMLLCYKFLLDVRRIGKLLNFIIFSLLVILYRKSTYFYGSYAGTCIPLHLQERFPIGWEYSAAIFICVNLSLLLVIAFLYLALFISIWRTQKLTPLGVIDYEFAVR